MHKTREYRSSIILAAAMAGAGLISACAGESQTVQTAPSHPWDAREAAAYERYMMDEHAPRREFTQLSPAQQQEYWNWRARNPGN